MPDYRRNRVPGGTYFLIAKLLDRRSELLVRRVDALRSAVRGGAAAHAVPGLRAFNPVKHGVAGHPAEWPFSSFRRCVAAGLYPADWGGFGKEAMEVGEHRS